MRQETEMVESPGEEENHSGLGYPEYFPALHRFAWRLLGNGNDAQDVVQEAFLALLVRGNGTDIRNKKAWLFRATANGCCDRMRGRNLFQKIAGAWLAQRPEPVSPERELLAESETGRVRAALNRLPQKKRIILLLHQEGLSHAEIARGAGVRKSSVAKLLARAMKQLAQEMTEGEKT
jgi:RNA polymerase sigma-70 factor, ECF subfamily